MDNAIRRDILARAKAAGYPGSITEAFQAYDQGKDLVQEYVQQQQNAGPQPPMQVAQTPQEQEQGLRPAHQAGNVNQSMAFPNVQPGQSFNTMGMKVPINIDKVDNQGNLVESFKAVPPGIANLPTGPYEGTVIESPAKMQKGGFHQKIYDDPLKFKKANQLYNDSLSLYNQYPEPDQYQQAAPSWGQLQNTGTAFRNNRYAQSSKIYFPSITNDQFAIDTKNKKGIAPIRLVADPYVSSQSTYVYKKPTQQPVYKEKPKEFIPTKTPRLEREPMQLVIPQSDRTLMPYNNTLQVLHSIQQEDRDKEGPKVVKAPTFQLGGAPKDKSIVSAEEEPEDVFPYEGTSSLFKDERYNIDRALELYKRDETGHLPSIDYETGEWLKAKRYPTSWKEFNEYALNPEVNALGFPTENANGYLKYPNHKTGGVKKYQTAGVKGEGVMSWEEAKEQGSQVHMPVMMNPGAKKAWQEEADRTYKEVGETGESGSLNKEKLLKTFVNPEDAKNARYPIYLKGKMFLESDASKTLPTFTNIPPSQINRRGMGYLKNAYYNKPESMVGEETPEERYIRAINAKNDSSFPKETIEEMAKKENWDPAFTKKVLQSKDKSTVTPTVVYKGYEKRGDFDKEYGPKTWIKSKEYSEWQKSKKLGGSYDTNQEISMYEWRSGLPEDSRKRYFIGGLKNRVLYNKAKYKR